MNFHQQYFPILKADVDLLIITSGKDVCLSIFKKCEFQYIYMGLDIQ